MREENETLALIRNVLDYKNVHNENARAIFQEYVKLELIDKSEELKDLSEHELKTTFESWYDKLTCNISAENSIGRRTMATYDGQHSRLVCKNLTCPFHSRPINRDQNSSKNIRDIMMFWFGHDFMPWIFRRYAEFLHPTTKNKA